jgi:hypothetical protein
MDGWIGWMDGWIDVLPVCVLQLGGSAVAVVGMTTAFEDTDFISNTVVSERYMVCLYIYIHIYNIWIY